MSKSILMRADNGVLRKQVYDGSEDALLTIDDDGDIWLYTGGQGVGQKISGGAPVTIEGRLGVGEIVQAVLAPGWTYTSIQWMREVNGVSSEIVGATGPQYQLVADDLQPGARVFATTAGLSYAAAGLRSPVLELQISGIPPSSAVAGVPYSFATVFSGGVPPYTPFISGPAGMVHDETGVHWDNPIAGAYSNIVPGVQDSLGTQAFMPPFALTVIAGALVPVNTTLPAITGTAQVGNALMASSGVWTNSPSSFAYQWLRTSGGATTPVSGALSSTYSLSGADVGYQMSVRVIASNGIGASAPATSSPTTVVSGSGSMTYGIVAANRLQVPTAVSGAAVPNLRAYQREHTSHSGGVVRNMRLHNVWRYISSSSFVLTAVTGSPSMTWRQWVEYPQGTFTPLTFGGSPDCVMSASASQVASDPLSITIPANAKFWVHTANAGASVLMPVIELAANADALGVTDAAYTMANLSSPAHQSAGSAALAFVGPFMITGDVEAAGAKGNLVLGDSIVFAQGDVSSAGGRGSSGLFGRLLDGSSSSYVKYAQRGATAQAIAEGVGGAAYVALMDSIRAACTHVLIQPGINDLRLGRTQSQVMANRATLTGDFPGLAIAQTTLTPRTSSTDGWATVANQSQQTDGNMAAWSATNTAIRALSGAQQIVEVANVVANVPGGLVWACPVGATPPVLDGTHPTSGMAAYGAANISYMTAETTPPNISSVVVTNASPTVAAITFSESMDTSFVPAALAFTVSGHTVSSVTFASPASLSVTVTPAFVNGEAARTLAYTQPGTNDLRDVAGNLLASVSGVAITNNVLPVDTTAPTLSSAVVNGASLVLTYNEELNTTAPATSAYSVVGAGGVTQAPTAINISGSAVTLMLATPAVSGNTVTLSYTVPGSNPIRDTAGNPAVALTGQAVTNSTTGAIPAVFATLQNLADEGGGTYASTSAGGPNDSIGVVSGSLAGNGYIEAQKLNTTDCSFYLRFDASPGAVTVANADFSFGVSTSGLIAYGENANPTVSSTNIGGNASTWIRLERSGSSILGKYSTDNRATWTTFQTFTATTLATLYVSVSVPYASGLRRIFNPTTLAVA